MSSSVAQTVAQHNAERPYRKWVAASQVFAGALFFSAVPIIVRYTASETHPFVFNAANWTGHGIAFLLFVLISAKRIFGKDATIGSVLAIALQSRSNVALWSSLPQLCRIKGQPSTRSGSRFRVDLANSQLHWLQMPMVWMVIASLNYALFFWSTRYIDVAVSATIYELWPLALVLTLARYDDPRVRSARREINIKKKVLMGVAFLGLILVILGQSDVTKEALNAFLSLGIFGALVALLSAILAGVYPALSIVYGDALHYEYIRHRSTDDGEYYDSHPAERESANKQERTMSKEIEFDKRENLWFTAVGIAVSSLMAVPVDIALSLMGSGSGAFGPGGRELSMGLLYGFLLGLVIVAGGTLFVRLANLNSDDLGINAIFYVTPVLALTWLAIAGISLPRLDLFLMGAALVLGINVIIQSSPDEEPEFAKVGAEPPKGTRLGFTSLILAIWFFSGMIYIRDEVLPASWLSWSGPDYWTLVALSATVFALIFGFRVARLTSRLTLEDETTIRLFRKVEHVLAGRSSKDETLDALRSLDTALPKNLPDRYKEVRRCLLEARSEFMEGQSADTSVTLRDFSELEEDLDKLAHSRQQGRDFSELISISLFALITVILGTVTRPSHLAFSDDRWSGFLIELFVALFVSVIAFLTFNLFDLRRNREILVMARVARSVEESSLIARFGTYDHQLFFRHKRNVSVAQTISVIIVSALIVLFASLLYYKWF